MAKYPSQVINVANAELGYLEKASDQYLDSKTSNAGKNNYTKYWRDIYPKFQKEAWCLCFAIWCFVKAFGEAAAKSLLLMTSGYNFYTPTAAQAFDKKGQFFKDPQVGDLIFFRSDSAEKQGRWRGVHHVGIVYKISGGKVYTIEGNTSSGAEVVPNGGAVCAKSYTLGIKEIAGYARPKYDIGADTWVETPIVSGRAGVTIDGTTSLNVRKGPGTSYAIAGSVKKGEHVQVTAKAKASDGTWWFKSQQGWISGKYFKGWLKESNNLWWYVETGYKYPAATVRKIDLKYYCFDEEGWLVTPDRLTSDGEVIPA